jgi:hypothetical protein
MRKCFLFLITLVMVGCAASITNLTQTQYRHQQFSPELLRSGGLAFFPITSQSGQSEGLRRPLGDRFNYYLASAFAGKRIMTWQVSMDSINNAGLVDTYQQFIEAYEKTAIVNKEKAGILSKSLGVRFALLCSLGDASEGSSLARTPNGGLTPKMHGNVEVQCHVVDLLNGDIMQDILGRVKADEAMFASNGQMPTYDKYAEEIAHSVVEQIASSPVARDTTAH